MHSTLLRKDGSVDRRAVMNDAWRICRDVQRRGWDTPGPDQWTWRRCLRFALARAREERRLRQMDLIASAIRQHLDQQSFGPYGGQKTGRTHPLERNETASV